jgi:hypothetical protein
VPAARRAVEIEWLAAAARSRDARRTGRARFEPEPAPPDRNTGGARSRRLHRVQVVLVLLVLAVGGAAAALHYHGSSRRHPGEAGEGATVTEEQRPHAGMLQVTSDPPGAAVWLKLGRSPVESVPIDPARAHVLRVEHEGYVSRDVTIASGTFAGAAAWDTGVVDVTVDLELAGRAAPELAEPVEPTDADPAPARTARVRISTRPEVSVVWLLVGVTPARIPLTGGTELELRVAHDGYVPAFASASADELDADGEAALSFALVPRVERAARRAPWAQAREIAARDRR